MEGGHVEGGGARLRCPTLRAWEEQALGGGRAAGFTLDAVIDLGLAAL